MLQVNFTKPLSPSEAIRWQRCWQRLSKVASKAAPVRKAQGLRVPADIHTGAPPQAPALREAISHVNPAFASRPPDGGGGAARDGAAGPCGGTSVVEGLEWQRLAAVRDSTECCALLLRTCNPSKRHWTGAVGSEMRVLSPEGAWNGVLKGCLGSGVPKLIPGGHREGRWGSK